MGLVFQLADDIIDISSDSKESGKTPGTDLKEGVPTLVTLHVLESNDPADRELKELLSAPIKDDAVVAQTLKALRTHRALDQAREVIDKYAKQTREHLAGLPDCDAKSALISLSDSVVSRTS